MTDDPGDRIRRLGSVVRAADGPDPMRGICRAAATALGASGAGLLLVDGGPSTPLAWSDRVSGRLGELQRTLGEGPGVDAHRLGRPVSEPDLGLPRHPRWPVFLPAALDAGAAGIFSFPLRVGGVRVGALTIHRTAAGALSDDQHADAMSVAAVAVAAILGSQAGAPPGALGVELESLVSFDAVIHRASGMVSVQLGIGVGEALVRLRAQAFASSRPLADIAADIVAGRGRLDE